MKPSQFESYLARLRDDYAFFVREIWDCKGWNTRHPWTYVEDDLCAFAADFSVTRKVVLAYREYGKTTLIGGTYPCWRWFRDCNSRGLVISKSTKHTSDVAHAIKGLLRTVPHLLHLQSGGDPEARDNRMAFDVAGAEQIKQASYTGLGINGQLEGNHVDWVIPDDIETKENSWTPEGREKLRHIASEIEHIVFKVNDEHRAGTKDMPGVLMLGTPKDDDSYYAYLVTKGYTVRAYPKVIPHPGEKVIGDLAPCLQVRIARGELKPDDIICPKRHDRRDIELERSRIPPSEFDRELKLLGNLAGTHRHPIRLRDLIVMDQVHRDTAPLSISWGTNQGGITTAVEGVPTLGFEGDRLYRPFHVSPQRAPYLITHAAIDPAFGGHDKTGFAVGGFLAGLIHVKSARGLDGGTSPEALLRLASLCREHGVNRVFIEQNQGRGMFDQLLWPVLQSLFLPPGKHPSYPAGWSCSIVHDTKITNAYGTAGKDARIVEGLGAVIPNHRMVIGLDSITPEPGEEVPHTLQHQLTHITKDRHSLGKPGVGEYGKVDALTLLCASFRSYLDVDPEEQAKDYKARELDVQGEIDRMANYLRKLGGSAEARSAQSFFGV